MATATTFFSYSRTDSAFVLKLAKDLRDAGAELWLDQLDILPGSRWDASIENALDASTSLIVILSAASVASNNVMDEVSFALENGKTVIPVLLDNCKLPFRLKRLQYIDFTNDYKTGFTHLLQALNVSVNENKISAPVNVKTTATEGIKSHIQQMPAKNENFAVKAQPKSAKKYLIIAAGILLLGFGIWRITQSGPDDNYAASAKQTDSLTQQKVNPPVTDSPKKIIPVSPDNQDNKIANKNYYVVIGSHKALSDAKAQVALLSATNIIYTIQIYKNENNVYAVCLDGQLADKEEAAIRLAYAKENIKIADAYIKSSSLWQKAE